MLQNINYSEVIKINANYKAWIIVLLLLLIYIIGMIIKGYKIMKEKEEQVKKE